MNTTRLTDSVEVILKDQRRRRWSLPEKAALVRRTYEPNMSVSLVARQEGIAASLLFQWRKLERQPCGKHFAIGAIKREQSTDIATVLDHCAKGVMTIVAGLPDSFIRDLRKLCISPPHVLVDR